MAVVAKPVHRAGSRRRLRARGERGEEAGSGGARAEEVTHLGQPSKSGEEDDGCVGDDLLWTREKIAQLRVMFLGPGRFRHLTHADCHSAYKNMDPTVR